MSGERTRSAPAVVFDDDVTVDGDGVAHDHAGDQGFADGSSASMRRVAPGQVIDRYTLVERIGEGGMGVVFRAHDPGLNREIALKLLLPAGNPRRHERRRDRLLREAQAIARLSHPNVVEVLNVGTYQGRVYVAMELIDGMTLAEWMEESRTWRQTLDLMISVGRGVQAIHAGGLVHRDLKPDNVMIGRDGRPRVMDLGLVRMDESSADASDLVEGDRLAVGLTADGGVVGTVGYIPPEAYSGRKVGPAGDQFSFAVVLHEVLTGRRPHPGQSPGEISAAVVEGRIDEPSKPPGPRALHAVIRRGLATRPEDRWPTVEAMVDALAGIGRPRSNLALWIVAGATSVAAGVALYGSPEQDVCPQSAARAESVWNDARRAAVTKSLLEAREDFGQQTAERVVETLDAYVEGWARARIEACELGRDAAAKLVDQRVACLDQAMDQLETLADMLEHADATVAQRAVFAARGLRSVAECERRADAASDYDQQDDPAAVARRASVHRTLALAETKASAGKYAEASAMVDGALLDGAVIASPRIRGSALSIAAEIAVLDGNLERGIERYEAAYADSMEARDAETSLRAAIGLTHQLGAAGQLVEAHRWLRTAQAIVTAEGETDQRSASLLLAEARLLVLETRFEDAVERLNEALARVDATRDPLRRALGLELLAWSECGLGHVEGCVDAATSALELKERTVGPNHPSIVDALLVCAEGEELQGNSGAAVAHRARAATLLEEAAGQVDSAGADALFYLGRVQHQQLDYAAAVETLARARAATERLYGARSPKLVRILRTRTAALADLGLHDEAIADGARAVALAEERSDTDPLQLGPVLQTLGTVYLDVGETQLAIDHLKRTVDLLSETSGPQLGMALALLAHAELAGGKNADASRHGVLAAEMGARMIGRDDPRLASLLSVVAAAEARQGNVERSSEYVGRALACLLELPNRPEIVPDNVRSALVAVQRLADHGARDRVTAALETLLEQTGDDTPERAAMIADRLAELRKTEG